MKLMIVDDSNIMRQAIQKYVNSFNFDIVATASDGMSAISLFKQYLPHIVTLDITMPELDGLSCLEEILAIKPETIVIIITALSDSETGIKAIKLGAKGFISKPFTERQLRDEFTEILKKEV